MKYGRLAIVACSLFLSISLAAAQSTSFLDGYLSRGFPENTEVRKQYWTSLITVPKEGAFAFKDKIVQTKSMSVKIGAIRREGDFLVQFVNGKDGSFVPWSQGSFSIQRDLKTGYFLQVKIFLQDDPGCYARLYPQAESTRMDIVMYGAVIKKGLYIPGLIYYALDDSFASLVAQTREAFDWSRVFGNGQVSGQAELADKLRSAYAPPQTVTAMMPLPTISAQAQPAPQSGTAQDAATASQAGAKSSLPLVPPPAPPPGLLPRPQALASLVAKAASIEALGQSLAARGESSAELPAQAADAPALAFGFSDDGDPLAPRLPYKAFARYEAGKGFPLAQLRAALFLDSQAVPGAAYAVVGESVRALAVTGFDSQGHFAISFFSDTRELDWTELAKAKDSRIRILRIIGQ